MRRAGLIALQAAALMDVVWLLVESKAQCVGVLCSEGSYMCRETARAVVTPSGTSGRLAHVQQERLWRILNAKSIIERHQDPRIIVQAQAEDYRRSFLPSC